MKTKPKVLIVDDRIENLVALEKVLAYMDVEFVRAMSGNEALAQVLDYDFALALVDVQMPDMDGFETVEIMRQDRKASHLPIIFVSAIYKEEFYQIKGIETGAIDFITKPIVPEILRGKVSIFLDLYEYRTSLEEQNQIITASHRKLQETLDQLKKAHTELKMSQEQLLQSEKMAAIGELVSGVAHEINNPLMAISGHAQILLDDVQDEESRESLEIIHQEIDRAADIVQNLLSFARREKTQKVCISLREDIESVVRLRAYELGQNNIEIVTEIEPDLPEIMIDSQHLKQVFLNLMNNAVYAMQEAHDRGKLVIRAKINNEDAVGIQFIDDGPGIPEDVRSRIFEPFFTTKDVGKGTGLGLSICYGIIQSYDGKIFVDSIEGDGATFTIELPVVPNEISISPSHIDHNVTEAV